MASDEETVVIDPALLQQKGVKYPLIVDYCHNCSMPFEVKFWWIRELCVLYLYHVFISFIHFWIDVQISSFCPDQPEAETFNPNNATQIQSIFVKL